LLIHVSENPQFAFQLRQKFRKAITASDLAHI